MSAIDAALARARARIAPRATVRDLAGAYDALIIDTRPIELRARDGEMPGAIVVDRNVLEWRLDPTSPHRIPQMQRADQRVILFCDEGYASSLAALSLQELGLTNVTDLAGGFQAWLARHDEQPTAAAIL